MLGVFAAGRILNEKTARSQCYGGMIFGIGAGWMEREYLAYDFDFPRPAVRLAQLEETLELVKLLWTQTPASYEGKYYKITNAYLEPKPDPVRTPRQTAPGIVVRHLLDLSRGMQHLSLKSKMTIRMQRLCETPLHAVPGHSG